MKITDFNVGDTVLLVEGWRRGPVAPVERPVVKVGRSLVYIEQYGQPWAFHADSGYERRGPNSAGVGSSIYTPEAWAEKQRRDAARDALAAKGVQFRYYSDEKNLTADQLERIAAILNEEEGK